MFQRGYPAAHGREWLKKNLRPMRERNVPEVATAGKQPVSMHPLGGIFDAPESATISAPHVDVNETARGAPFFLTGGKWCGKKEFSSLAAGGRRNRRKLFSPHAAAWHCAT